MTRSRVALVRCDTYDDNEVRGAVRTGLDLIGGISAFVKPDERIVVKITFSNKPDSTLTFAGK